MKKKVNILSSYPRSGNTWIRYCIEFLSERPTLGCGRINLRECPLGETFNLGVDLKKEPILKKVHLLANKYKEDTTNVVIQLIRNPLYSIPRHTGKNEFWFTGAYKFIKLLEAYHNYEGKKQVFYYEDFMVEENLYSSLKEMCELLEVNLNKMDELRENYNAHVNRSRMLYDYVRKKELIGIVNLQEEEKWIEYFKSHKELYELYLKRYF